MKKTKLTSRDWFAKASAGTIAGFFLSLALCIVFARFGPGEIGGYSPQAQFTMWLMGILWALILSLCFLFPTGARAWLWLGGANVIFWGLHYGSLILIG